MKINHLILKRNIAAACMLVLMGAPLAVLAQDMPPPDFKQHMQHPPMEGVQHEMGGMHEMGHHGGIPFLHAVNLTEAQHDQIFMIMHNQAPQMREHAKAARKAHQELQMLATSGKYDDAKAKSLADTAARAIAGMALLHARSESAIYALLTPEQHAQIEAMKAKMQERHHAMKR
jgi:Spy/CpxP family protein refolding chaperone